MGERIIVKNEAAQHIQAYIDYTNIVGGDDDGKLMTEKDFEDYKNKVRFSRQHRLHTHWRNPKGDDCKAIGPSSMCFCGHRYKRHAFDNIDTKDIHCKEKKCLCPLFDYVPVYPVVGSQDLKCLTCKHSYKEHEPLTRKCIGVKGCVCRRFTSSHYCNCGIKVIDHKTVYEKREERENEGKQVDPAWMQANCMAGGMGGLSSYNELAGGTEKEQMKMKSIEQAYANQKTGQITGGVRPGFITAAKGLPPPQYSTDAQEEDPECEEEFRGKQMQIKHIRKEMNALELFRTPHKYGGNIAHTGSATKAIAPPANKLGTKKDIKPIMGNKMKNSRVAEGLEKAKVLAEKKKKLSELNAKMKEQKKIEEMGMDLQGMKL